MFDKVKQLIAHAFDANSVQVELIVTPIPETDSLATGTVRLTARRDVHVDRLEVQMIQRRVIRRLRLEHGSGGSSHGPSTTSREIGRCVDPQDLNLKAGQVVEVPFEVLFQRRETFAQGVRDEMGEGAGALASVLANEASVDSKYHLRAFAHVSGTLISPHTRCDVEFV